MYCRFIVTRSFLFIQNRNKKTMRQLRGFLCLIYFYTSFVQTKILYECNFDISTENCFNPRMNVSSGRRSLTNMSLLNEPLSDVTSICKHISYIRTSICLSDFHLAKPTHNGELCRLSYRIKTLNSDVYFCNQGYCPTKSSANSRCQSG